MTFPLTVNSYLFLHQFSMSLNIEVFYSFQSPYSYLAMGSIYALQDKYDVQFSWQPFSARAAGQQVHAAPITPEKLSYIIEDTKRIAQDLKIRYTIPTEWPANEFDPSKITRGAIVASDMGCLTEYNCKVFYRCWGLGQNPNDETFLAELADDIDVDLNEFMAKASSTDTRDRVKGIYKRGHSLGVFNTPTFVIDKERIYGIDKLHYLEQRLIKLGLKKRA